MIWRKIYLSVLSIFNKLLSRIIHFNICKNCGNFIMSSRLIDCLSSSFEIQNMTKNVAFFFLPFRLCLKIHPEFCP